MICLYDCNVYYSHDSDVVKIADVYKINNVVYIDEDFATTPSGKMFKIQYIDKTNRLKTIIDYEDCFRFVPKEREHVLTEDDFNGD